MQEIELREPSSEDVMNIILTKLKPYKNIYLNLSLEELAHITPEIHEGMKQILTKNTSVLHTLEEKLRDEDSDYTYIYLTVNGKCIIAILDTGAPKNIVLTKLMNAIKLAPDVNYQKKFGTAGPSSTESIGAYSTLSVKIGHIVVQTPAIILKNNSYDMLIRHQFLKKMEMQNRFRKQYTYI